MEQSSEPKKSQVTDYAEWAEFDREQAEAFLLRLDEAAEYWTFQTFDDDKARKDKRLARVINDTLEGAWPQLVTMSRQGCGIFVTVNETDGAGRKLGNMRRIRAVWHEDDHGVPREFPLSPDMTVVSSPGKFHRYWLVSDDMTTCEFRGVMDTLVRKYGGDPDAKGLSRVLRLPGFPNRKPAYGPVPHMVRMVD